MSASLLIDGPGAWALSREISDRKENVIGRSRECEVQLNDGMISSRHAVIATTGTGWEIRDLDSRNGLSVNGKKAVKNALKNGDVIRIGNTDIVFKCKSATPEAISLDETRIAINGHQADLQAAIRAADARSAVRVPDMHFPRGGTATLAVQEEPVLESFVGFETERGAFPTVPEIKENDLSSADHLWIAERLTELLGQLAMLGSRTKTEVFIAALNHLKKTVHADNGFLMIPNRAEKRWVVTAWVGNSEEWTDFGKSQPVPLTIANKAFKLGEVVSNAVSSLPEAPESPSLLALNVHLYIAVPLMQNNQREGLLYFDTRTPFGTFGMRDVKLLERAGDYLVELERRLADQG